MNPGYKWLQMCIQNSKYVGFKGLSWRIGHLKTWLKNNHSINVWLKNKSIMYCLYRKRTWGPHMDLWLFFFDLDRFGYFYSDLDIEHLNTRLLLPCPNLKKPIIINFISLLFQSLQRPEGQNGPRFLWSQLSKSKCFQWLFKYEFC